MTSFNHQTFLVSDGDLLKTTSISSLDCRKARMMISFATSLCVKH
jgi:hypothetical protein